MCLAYVYIYLVNLNTATFYLRVISFILIKPRVEEKPLHVHLKNSFDRNFCIEKKDKKTDRKKIHATLVFPFFCMLHAAVLH